MSVFHLCDSCTTAIVNADTSGLDDADAASLDAFTESVGYLVDAGTVPQPGYWDCEACGDVQIGSAHAMEQLN